MPLTPGLVVVLAGVGMVELGWLLFRRRGVTFLTFAPVWRANHYLKPPGAVLTAVGCVAALVGAVLLFARAGA
jgi:hypothetical protein